MDSEPWVTAFCFFLAGARVGLLFIFSRLSRDWDPEYTRKTTSKRDTRLRASNLGGKMQTHVLDQYQFTVEILKIIWTSRAVEEAK